MVKIETKKDLSIASIIVVASLVIGLKIKSGSAVVNITFDLIRGTLAALHLGFINRHDMNIHTYVPIVITNLNASF